MIVIACIAALISALSAVFSFYHLKKSLKKETSSIMREVILICVIVISTLSFLGFSTAGIIFISDGSGGSDSSNDSNSFYDLPKEEQEWYHRNYGNGQYDKYKDAVNNYNGY